MRCIKSSWILIWAVALIPTASLSAAETEAPALTPEQEAARQYLEANIMAPCCWQPLSDHDSGISRNFKSYIRDSLIQGKSQEDVLQAFVEQEEPIRGWLQGGNFKVEGVQILARPPAKGFGLFAYIMPVAGVLFGLGLVSLFFKRLLASHPALRTKAAGSKVEAEELDPHRRQIEKELSSYDF